MIQIGLAPELYYIIVCVSILQLGDVLSGKGTIVNVIGYFFV